MPQKSETQEAFFKTLQSSVVRFSGTLIGLFLSQFIAQQLGASDLGILNLSNRITQFALIVALFGFRKHLLREISILRTKSADIEIHKSLHSTRITAFLIALVFFIVAIIALSPLEDAVFRRTGSKWPFLILASGIFAQVEARLCSACLLAYGKVWQSHLTEKSLSFVFIGLGHLTLYVCGVSMSLILTACIYTASRFLVHLWVLTITKGVLPTNGRLSFKHYLREIPAIIPKTYHLFIYELYFILFSSISVYWLGWKNGMTSVALFTVSLQLSRLITILLQLNNSALSNPIARLYAQSDWKNLRIILQNSSFVLTVAAASFIVLLYLFAVDILKLWGDEFVASREALLILCGGQFINAMTGSTGLALIMAGFDKISAQISFWIIVFNVALCAILIPHFGLVGAALAVSISTAADNIVKLVLVKRKMNIWVIPIPRLSTFLRN